MKKLLDRVTTIFLMLWIVTVYFKDGSVVTFPKAIRWEVRETNEGDNKVVWINIYNSVDWFAKKIVTIPMKDIRLIKFKNETTPNKKGWSNEVLGLRK